MGFKGGVPLVAAVTPVTHGPLGDLIQQFGVDVGVVDVANIVVVHQRFCFGNLELTVVYLTFDTLLHIRIKSRGCPWWGVGNPGGVRGSSWRPPPRDFADLHSTPPPAPRDTPPAMPPRPRLPPPAVRAGPGQKPFQGHVPAGDGTGSER